MALTFVGISRIDGIEATMAMDVMETGVGGFGATVFLFSDKTRLRSKNRCCPTSPTDKKQVGKLESISQTIMDARQ